MKKINEYRGFERLNKSFLDRIDKVFMNNTGRSFYDLLQDERKEILEMIDNQITKVEEMTCSDVLKQNMKWNLEELKQQLTNSEGKE